MKIHRGKGGIFTEMDFFMQVFNGENCEIVQTTIKQKNSLCIDETVLKLMLYF